MVFSGKGLKFQSNRKPESNAFRLLMGLNFGHFPKKVLYRIGRNLV